MPTKSSKSLLRTEFQRFNHDQTYEGEFFRDSFHGEGRYEWRNAGVYEGGFFSNFKEGYASFSFLDGSCFEGLFIKDKPFGPGILTYSNGRQDAGFWLGSKLVRLSRAVDFIIPRLAPSAAAKIKLLQFRRLITLDEKNVDSITDILVRYGLTNSTPSLYSTLIYDPRSLFFDSEAFHKAYFTRQPITDLPDTALNSIRLSEEEDTEDAEEENDYKESYMPPHCRCSKDVFEMIYQDDDFDICEKASVHGEFEMGILTLMTKYGKIESEEGEEEQKVEEEEEEAKKSKIVSWNRSELCTEMLKQIYKHRDFEDKLTFDLGQLMLGVRTAFRRTGEKEKQCVQFLKMCSLGPPQIIKEFLCNYEISEELMDGRGNNSLMFAAATDQHQIIDLLLDYGVDVNTFNDEGLTPLNLCLLRRLAVANDIHSWETAFLPREIEEVEDAPDQPAMPQSIPSLDRIFGDGMSISDRSQIVDMRLFSLFQTPSLARQPCIPDGLKNAEDLSKEETDKSQVTLLNMPKSPGSYSLILHEIGDEVVPPEKNGNAGYLQEGAEFVRKGGSSEQMFKKTDKIVPRSVKMDEYEKSMMESKEETYFFGFSFEKSPKIEAGREWSKGKTNGWLEDLEEIEEVDETSIVDVAEKIVEIDKTIEKLLRRGSNPNISEVPKPSIHLAVYTKNFDTVEILLQYGADPNGKLYPNEGLLTPLHVVVLQKPSPEFVEICKILLNFGGNPEQETSPDFAMCEEEISILVEDRGRTPLELLCMRPDVEYADLNDSLILIGQILAKVSDPKRYYYGHSCLTLAMISGNVKLLKALLDTRHFDPNDVLQCERGTTLHVLVSTELQRKTSYDTSIKMCDLLLQAGANPNKKFKTPEKLYGTCVEYGYREIYAEKEARKFDTASGKRSAGKEKPNGKDYLKDHERVVEYLKNKRNEKRKKKRRTYSEEVEDEEEEGDTKGKITGDLLPISEKGKMENLEKQKAIGKGEMENLEKQKAIGKGEMENLEKQKAIGKGEMENLEKQKAIGKGEMENLEKQKAVGKGKMENLEKQKAIKKGEKRQDVETNTSGRGEITKTKGKGTADGEKDKTLAKDRDKVKTNSKRDVRQKGSSDKEVKHKVMIEKKPKKPDLLTQEKPKAIESGKLQMKPKQSESVTRKISQKKIGCRSETFPERLRQTLLRMYGTCGNIDVNEFVVPYVVLRNGELYYKFQGKATASKEQYSLV